MSALPPIADISCLGRDVRIGCQSRTLTPTNNRHCNGIVARPKPRAVYPVALKWKLVRAPLIFAEHLDRLVGWRNTSCEIRKAVFAEGHNSFISLMKTTAWLAFCPPTTCLIGADRVCSVPDIDRAKIDERASHHADRLGERGARFCQSLTSARAPRYQADVIRKAFVDQWPLQ